MQTLVFHVLKFQDILKKVIFLNMGSWDAYKKSFMPQNEQKSPYHSVLQYGRKREKVLKH